MLNRKDAWIKYNSVDFENKKFTSVIVKAYSEHGGFVQIRLNSVAGPIVAEVKITEGNKWNIITAPISKLKSGVQNLVVILEDNNRVEIDWISFE